MRIEPLFEVGGLIWFLVLLLAAWGAFLAWRWYQTHKLGGDVFAAKREFGELNEHVSETEFRAAFIAAEAPRGATYTYVSAVICALIIPPAMAVFARFWREVWSLSGQYPPAAHGTMVYTFCLFLFCVAIMVGVLYVAMKRYYQTLPPPLDVAVKNLNGATS